MIQLCVQCPGNDMYVSLWQILMTWWTKDFSDIIFPMDNIICNVLFFGEDLSKIPMNKRRSFLTFGNAKLEPHTVHMLLSYYQDITFNEQSHVPTGCVSIWIKTKYWYCTSKFEAVNANPSASLGGDYWESLPYKSSTCFFSIQQHFSTSILVGENTNRKRVLKYITTYNIWWRELGTFQKRAQMTSRVSGTRGEVWNQKSGVNFQMGSMLIKV